MPHQGSVLLLSGLHVSASSPVCDRPVRFAPLKEGCTFDPHAKSALSPCVLATDDLPAVSPLYLREQAESKKLGIFFSTA